MRDVFLAGGSRTSNTAGPEVLTADCLPLFALEPRLIACWESTPSDPSPLFKLESAPLFALGSRPIACRMSDPLDSPPLFALDPPPLIALES